jgi:hypothetical protein
MDRGNGWPTDETLAWTTYDSGHLLVDKGGPSVNVNYPNSFLRGLEDLSVSLFTIAKRRFGELSVGNVPEGGNDPDDMPRVAA